MKILVLGDNIEDRYRHFTATRLCPEGPVPILTKTKEVYSTSGGAGLVAAQLRALFSEQQVVFIPGSHSIKERIFADDRLMLRIDEDSINNSHPAVQESHKDYLKRIHYPEYDAVVVGDYNKGALTKQEAKFLVSITDDVNIPLFVDAKNNFEWYLGAFAAFPNEKEVAPFAYFKNVIYKLGANGCNVEAVHIPTTPRAVKDTTGAGDIFLAAFVYEYLKSNDNNPATEKQLLQCCARFANEVAGISVEYVGTHVVTHEEINARN